MAGKKQKLELTWVGKDERPKLEPRILIEDRDLSYHADKRYSDDDVFDNMVIQGDNLLALKALEQDYAGQVKCIYIDPPFNTGNAFEHYDDGLEHSIWLSLMRDRLELLKNLLSKDGAIFVQLDDHESAYCKVLMDEVFGRSNYLNEIILSTNKPFGFKSTATNIFKQANHILFYAKDKKKLKLNTESLFKEKTYDKAYKWVFDDLAKPENQLSWKPISLCVASDQGYNNAEDAQKELGDDFDLQIALYAIENAERVFRTASVSGGAFLKRKDTIK